MSGPRQIYEVNFDGLIGPTHNYSGLAYGNFASLSSRYHTSSPKQAALQGLQKMKLLHSLGVRQGLIPPQERPDMAALRGKGFSGDDGRVLGDAWTKERDLFLSCCSASSMWCANAATVSPSADTRDGKCHITAANLRTHFHRAIEARQTARLLREIFRGEAFAVHDPLRGDGLLDEGAANHVRLYARPTGGAVNVFVYGQASGGAEYPARQSLAASQMIAARHQLEETGTVFVEQDPQAIALGVFHNDVIATGNGNFFLAHGRAYRDQDSAIGRIKAAFRTLTGGELITVEIPAAQLSVDEAVKSYLFNSQIVTLPNGDMVLIAPVESAEGRPRAIIDEIIKGDNPVKAVYFSDLRQSMANGGGPACLRLRVTLNEDELSQVHPGYLLDDGKFALLEEWVRAYYREILTVDELKNAELLEESRRALDELTKMLGLGNIYPFQQ